MMVAARPGMGARNERARRATTTATASPARTARHLSGGTVRRSIGGSVQSVRRGSLSLKRNRSARPTRIGGFAKGAGPRSERDAIASQGHLLLLGLLSSLLLLRRHQDHPLLATRCSIYRHTHVMYVNR